MAASSLSIAVASRLSFKVLPLRSPGAAADGGLSSTQVSPISSNLLKVHSSNIASPAPSHKRDEVVRRPAPLVHPPANRYLKSSRPTMSTSRVKRGQSVRHVYERPVAEGVFATLTSEPLKEPLLSSAQEETRIIEELVPLIKKRLSCIRNSYGEIGVSAYDTAWAARIPDSTGSGKPHFPESLEWLLANQHADGSWGDNKRNWLYDRFIQTLASIVALKSWNLSPSAIQKGEEFITVNVNKLEEEEVLSMPIGFELAFPGLLSEAKSLGMRLPYEAPFFQVVEQHRDKKLKRVPLELLHSQPTSMLHTLEGLQSLDIDWARVLKFRSEDGSMCCSPSATVVLYLHTGDEKCLSFLESLVKKFNGAIPTCYPLDTFHNLWVVDTLERLGISRYFKDDIDYILENAYKHWSDEQGICWASVLKDVPDLDDTSMAFRLLRQHGYEVSAEAFKVFQKDKGFQCFAVGQMVQGVSDMFNLLRASKTAYPKEDRLVAAEAFSRGFLVDASKNKKANADKWSLKKDLAGEVEYALKHPEHKSFYRQHVEQYLDKYGPEDVWIGKSMYRLHLVNDHDYLRLARADYSLCQKMHQMELQQILTWISESGLPGSLGKCREEIVTLYTMFSAELWEPKFSNVRLAVANCMFIASVMQELFEEQSFTLTDLGRLVEAVRRWDPTTVHELPEKLSSCFMLLYNTFNYESTNKSIEDSGPLQQAVQAWEELLALFMAELARRQDQSSLPLTHHAEKIMFMTSALKKIMLISHLTSGEKHYYCNPDVNLVTQMEQDSTFTRTIAEAIILAQDMAFRKDELYFQLKQRQILEELNLLQWGQESPLPDFVKRVLLSFVKVVNVYHGGDYEESLAQLALTP